MWALSEAYVLLGLRSYLEWFGKFSSGGQHTHLGAKVWGLILSDLGSSQVAANTLILEQNHPPSGVTFLTHHHKFSHSISFHFLHSIFMFLSLSYLICCFWVSLIIMSMVHHLGGHDHHWCLPCAHFQFRNCILFSPYLVFDLCLYEVNFYTYLTTWLSSCPMGIFLNSSPLIVKIPK